MGTAATGKNCKTLRQKYGLNVFVQNIGLDGPDSEEPALCIGVNRFGKRRACVIPLSTVHNYRDDEYLIQKSMEFSDVLGFGSSDKSMTLKIADAILEGLDDLVRHAPDDEVSPEKEIENAVEKQGLIISLNGKKIVG